MAPGNLDWVLLLPLTVWEAMGKSDSLGPRVPHKTKVLMPVSPGFCGAHVRWPIGKHIIRATGKTHSVFLLWWGVLKEGQELIAINTVCTCVKGARHHRGKYRQNSSESERGFRRCALSILPSNSISNSTLFPLPWHLPHPSHHLLLCPWLP